MVHVLVTGASGLVGSHVAARLAAAGHEVTGTFREHEDRIPAGPGPLRGVALDLGDEASCEAAFRAAWPEAVVHCAALSDLKRCEADPDLANAVNVAGTAKLARMAATLGARFLFLSTDQVFDGAQGNYAETAEAAPIHAYGRSKLEAERLVRRCHPSAAILRLALVFGSSPSGDRSASEQVARALAGGAPCRLFTDEFRSPVFVDDVAALIEEALLDRDVGLLHVAGPECVSRYEFGLRVAAAYGLDAARIEPIAHADVELMPPRPKDLTLDTRRLRAWSRNPPRPIAEALGSLVGARA
jgi:dTDP-4-dehydrorhamnose reductase